MRARLKSVVARPVELPTFRLLALVCYEPDNLGLPVTEDEPALPPEWTSVRITFVQSDEQFRFYLVVR